MAKRFEQMAEKAKYVDFDGNHAVLVADTIALLQRERKAVVQKVKALAELDYSNMSADFQAGQHLMTSTLLAWLNERGR